MEVSGHIVEQATACAAYGERCPCPEGRRMESPLGSHRRRITHVFRHLGKGDLTGGEHMCHAPVGDNVVEGSPAEHGDVYEVRSVAIPWIG
jgi:hypothetical protein